jgi:hypothetical protein
MLCRQEARFSECYTSVIGMAKPEGTEYAPYMGYNTPNGWNTIADGFLKSTHEYLFTMNDDHIYPPDTLTRLMSHGVECVSGVYLLRQYPYEPVIYDYVDKNGAMGYHYLTNGERGLVPIKVCGDGALLIHRRVFEKIPPPWYRLNGPPAPPDIINCDVLFCELLRNNGIQIYADLDVQIGHIAIMPVWPHRKDDDTWETWIGQGNGAGISLPAATPSARVALEAEMIRRKQLAELGEGA